LEVKVKEEFKPVEESQVAVMNEKNEGKAEAIKTVIAKQEEVVK